MCNFQMTILPKFYRHFFLVFFVNRKNILLEASQHCDFTSETFKEIQKSIELNLQNINPTDEYREFTEKHKYILMKLSTKLESFISFSFLFI